MQYDFVTSEILKETMMIVDGHVKQVIKNERPEVSLNENQPLFSILKNCTAGYPSLYYSVFHWGVIGCDEQFQAAYVCQKNTTVQNLTVHHANDTCDEGWVLLADTQKCYLLLKPTPNITFVDSQRICERKSSNVLSIDPAHTEYSSTEGSYVFNWMQLHYFDPFGTYLLSFITTSYVNKMIYGQLLQKNEPEII